jgi:hypothetical protein
VQKPEVLNNVMGSSVVGGKEKKRRKRDLSSLLLPPLVRMRACRTDGLEATPLLCGHDDDEDDDDEDDDEDGRQWRERSPEGCHGDSTRQCSVSLGNQLKSLQSAF